MESMTVRKPSLVAALGEMWRHAFAVPPMLVAGGVFLAGQVLFFVAVIAGATGLAVLDPAGFDLADPDALPGSDEIMVDGVMALTVAGLVVAGIVWGAFTVALPAVILVERHHGRPTRAGALVRPVARVGGRWLLGMLLLLPLMGVAVAVVVALLAPAITAEVSWPLWVLFLVGAVVVPIGVVFGSIYPIALAAGRGPVSGLGVAAKAVVGRAGGSWGAGILYMLVVFVVAIPFGIASLIPLVGFLAMLVFYAGQPLLTAGFGYDLADRLGLLDE